MFNRVVGQVEGLAGQVNFKGSLPRSENNVLQPMLHPDLSYLEKSKKYTLCLSIATAKTCTVGKN